MPKGKARTPRVEENHDSGLNQEAFSALGQEQHDNIRPTRFQNSYGPVIDKHIVFLLFNDSTYYDLFDPSYNCMLGIPLPTPN